MLIKVLSVLSMLSKLPPGGGGGGGGATGLLNKGRGSNRLPALVTKQQAVEFLQILADYSTDIIVSLQAFSFLWGSEWVGLRYHRSCLQRHQPD